MADAEKLLVDPRIEAVANKVRFMAIWGYLPSTARVKDRPIVVKENAEGFYHHGNGAKMGESIYPHKSDEAKFFRRLVGRLANETFKDKGKSVWLLSQWRVKKPDSEEMIVAIGGAQSPSRLDPRGGQPTPYVLYCEMPGEAATELLALVQEDPVSLETFYQLVFSGLDSEPDKDTGLRRIKTKLVYLVDIEKLKESVREARDENIGYKSTVRQVLAEATKLELPYHVGVRD